MALDIVAVRRGGSGFVGAGPAGPVGGWMDRGGVERRVQKIAM